MMKAFIKLFSAGFALGAAGILFTSSGPAAAAGNPARGATLYEDKCSGCHSVDANRIGPAHRGVFGRKAGLAPGFSYSPAVRKSKIVWNEKTLDLWLTNPGKTIPGSRMGFQLSDATQRADVIAFLKQQTVRKR
jgi:cytochrome c